jgi:hypothetical protein
VLEADYAYDRALITWRKLFQALAEEGTLPARSRILEEEPS